MKVLIKLSRRHPQGAMQFGRHSVTLVPKEIELNDAEVKDLKNDGPQFWFAVEKIENERPKKEVERPKKERKKKARKKVSE